MKELKLRRVFHLPKATQQTHGRIWRGTQLSDSVSLSSQTLSAVGAHGLTWPWTPPPPSPPASQPVDQPELYHIARCPTPHSRHKMTMRCVFFPPKERERERERSRGWEKNCSHHKFLSGPLPRFEVSGTASKIRGRRGRQGSWATVGLLRVQKRLARCLSQTSPQKELHNCGAIQKEMQIPPGCKNYSAFREGGSRASNPDAGPSEHRPCVTAEVTCP